MFARGLATTAEQKEASLSELAFDGNGDPITFPAQTEELRVRRFRNPGMRGACEVVHDQDGAPLYVPVDTSYLDFRASVGGVAGRYRLDAADANRRVIDDGVPAYVTITEPPRYAAAGPVDDRDSVIRELVRANTDMVRTIADRFSNVMQAAADLLRAADGAGMPRREAAPVPPPPLNPADSEQDEEEDEDEEDDDEADSPDITSLINQLLPTIQMWLAAKASEKAAAKVPVAAPVPVSPAAPAPAHVAATETTTSMAGAAAGLGSTHADAAPATSSGTDLGASVHVSPRTDASVHGGSAATQASGPAGAARNVGSGPSHSQTAHLLAIYAALSREEKRIVQVVIQRMGPETRGEWLAELSAMSVGDAVALVRSLIPPRRDVHGTEGDS